MTFALKLVVGLALYALGVVIAYASGMRDEVSGAGWIVFCVAWGLVAGCLGDWLGDER